MPPPVLPNATNPWVQQFGMSTHGGALDNMLDGDETTFWQPYADGFDAYTVPPVGDAAFPIVGANCPAIQFDFGTPVSIAIFRVKVETVATLGWTWLLASDNTATGTEDVVQEGDIYAGRYTVRQMNSNVPLITFAATQDIRKRYWRFAFFKNPPAGVVDNWPT